MPLTKRQREILDYLNEYTADNGYAPSFEEIAARSPRGSERTRAER